MVTTTMALKMLLKPLVPAETAAGERLGVNMRHIQGYLLQSHVGKGLAESRWQRHQAEAANVL